VKYFRTRFQFFHQHSPEVRFFAHGIDERRIMREQCLDKMQNRGGFCGAIEQ
jgi:hypothetical protein